VWVDHAAIAVYACRSLEQVLSCRDVSFAAGPPDSAGPAPPDHQRVLTILAEADDDDYWFAASRDGNREAHYRGAQHASALMTVLTCCALIVLGRERAVLMALGVDSRLVASREPARWATQSMQCHSPGSCVDHIERLMTRARAAVVPRRAGPHVGATLMHKPEAFRVGHPDSQLAMLVRRFQERIERELPSMYVWFAESSLHVTLRALES